MEPPTEPRAPSRLDGAGQTHGVLQYRLDRRQLAVAQGHELLEVRHQSSDRYDGIHSEQPFLDRNEGEVQGARPVRLRMPLALQNSEELFRLIPCLGDDEYEVLTGIAHAALL